jgi:hypothetical protein
MIDNEVVEELTTTLALAFNGLTTRHYNVAKSWSGDVWIVVECVQRCTLLRAGGYQLTATVFITIEIPTCKSIRLSIGA